MKLIHSGKVLKDEQTIESCGIKATDFLVVMVTKPKKAAAAPAPPAAAAAAPAVAPPAPAPEEVKAPAEQPAEPPAAAAAAVAPSPPVAPAPSAGAEFPAELVGNLTGMGFPEPEVLHCLRAARGNPDIAVEFLTNGIPPGLEPGGSETVTASRETSSSSSSGGPLLALRNHPQFDDLRRLVRSNPQMLQTVLTQIGQQQPSLLAEINANQEAFLAMMNEPIEESSSSSGSGPAAPLPPGGADDDMGFGAGMMDGMADPAQMAAMIQNMTPTQMNEMARMMGMSPEQLRTTAQMLGQIPPEQLQEYMAQAMDGGLPDMMGGGGGGGGGPQVLRLTEEEMAAVDRLCEMGFDRTEAAQAFLACDKNEALAANLLMDGGFGFGGDMGGGGPGNDLDDDNGDDMYD